MRRLFSRSSVAFCCTSSTFTKRYQQMGASGRDEFSHMAGESGSGSSPVQHKDYIYGIYYSAAGFAAFFGGTYMLGKWYFGSEDQSSAHTLGIREEDLLLILEETKQNYPDCNPEVQRAIAFLCVCPGLAEGMSFYLMKCLTNPEDDDQRVAARRLIALAKMEKDTVVASSSSSSSSSFASEAWSTFIRTNPEWDAKKEDTNVVDNHVYTPCQDADGLQAVFPFRGLNDSHGDFVATRIARGAPGDDEPLSSMDAPLTARIYLSLNGGVSREHQRAGQSVLVPPVADHLSHINSCHLFTNLVTSDTLAEYLLKPSGGSILLLNELVKMGVDPRNAKKEGSLGTLQQEFIDRLSHKELVQRMKEHQFALLSGFTVHSDFSANAPTRGRKPRSQRRLFSFEGKPIGEVRGAHSMLLLGCREDPKTGKKYYLVQNWWESMQFVEMDEEYLRTCLGERGGKISFVKRTQKQREAAMLGEGGAMSSANVKLMKQVEQGTTVAADGSQEVFGMHLGVGRERSQGGIATVRSALEGKPDS